MSALSALVDEDGRSDPYSDLLKKLSILFEIVKFLHQLPLRWSLEVILMMADKRAVELLKGKQCAVKALNANASIQSCVTHNRPKGNWILRYAYTREFLLPVD